MSMRIATVTVCISTFAALGLQPPYARSTHASEIATFTTLPSLGRGSEALAINGAGTMIVGSAWDRSDLLHAVAWTLQANGSWTITSLPWPPGASSTIARGNSHLGDVAGNDYPGKTSRAILWPATGGVSVLGCTGDLGTATVYGISANALVVAGVAHAATARPSVWRPGSCREDLPGVSGTASAVNGDGTIIGGATVLTQSAAAVPARWREIGGQWQIEQLDTRPGIALGANAAGDLAGYVVVPCSLPDGCDRAVIWYASGSSRDLGTLDSEHSWIRDINNSNSGEVVGGSTAPHIGNTAYFWSVSTGMVQLPFRGRWAAASALSDVRPDGTRVVVGMNSQGQAIVWMVSNP
jgi:hypothetical protein